MSLHTKPHEKCFRCQASFNTWVNPPHLTPFHRKENIVYVIYPLCQPCFNSIEDMDKRKFYLDMWIIWEKAKYPVQYKNDTSILSSWAMIIDALQKELGYNSLNCDSTYKS